MRERRKAYLNKTGVKANSSRQIADGGVGHGGWEAKEVNGEILKEYQIEELQTHSVPLLPSKG